jgi:hypothetical protein
LLPAPLAPRREMRSFGIERGVVTVAGMHHRGVVKRSKILLSRSFIKDVKFSGLLVLPGPQEIHARAVPNGEVRCRPRPAPSAGLGRVPGPRIVTPWDRVWVLDIRVLHAPCP